MHHLKINNIEVSVEFSFERESEIGTEGVLTASGPDIVDVWYTYYYMSDFNIVKVSIDGKEIKDYTKELDKEQVDQIESEVAKHGEALAEDMAEEMENDYCEEPDEPYDDGYMYEP